jgi:hypothetical protein
MTRNAPRPWNLPTLRSRSFPSRSASTYASLPTGRHACRNVGVIRGFSQASSLFSGVLRGFVFGLASAAQSLMPTDCTPTDTILVIRCPYCLAGMDYRQMISYKDGRFVCRDCAHTVRPGVPDYSCTCRHCLTLKPCGIRTLPESVMLIA